MTKNNSKMTKAETAIQEMVAKGWIVPVVKDGEVGYQITDLGRLHIAKSKGKLQ